MSLSLVILYGTLGLCAVGVGLLVMRYDLDEREPLHALAWAALLGALMMFVAGRAQVGVLGLLGDGQRGVSNFGFATLAGVTEEVAKLVAVLMVAVTCRRCFNEPIDGLIYGSFAGLGAALEESVAVLTWLDPSPFLPMQEPIRLAGHLVMGGIGGFGVGFLACRRARAPLTVGACLLGAVALHVVWDVVAFEAADTHALRGRVAGWQTAASVAVMLGGMVSYRGLVSRGAALAAGQPSSGGAAGGGVMESPQCLQNRASDS